MLRGHTAAVNSVAFHPDGKRLVSGSVDKTVRQWDVGAGRMIDVRRGHSGEVLAVTYSPDGLWIASSGEDGTVRIWKDDDSEPPTVLHDHDGRVQESFFSPDGLTVSTTSDKARWRIWPTPTASNRLVLRGHSSYVYPVVYSPDGRLLASAGWDEDHGIRLWDAASGRLVAVLTGHKYAIFCLAFSPDSRRLISRSDDATLRVWDAETGAPLAVLNCDVVEERSGPQSVVVTPDGRTIFTGAPRGLRCWDLAMGKEHDQVPLPLQGVRILAVQPRGDLLAASGNGPNIVLFDLAAGKIQTMLTHPTGRSDVHTHSLAFSPDGRQLLSAGRAGEIQLWDVESGKLVRELRGHGEGVFAAIFHPDGQRIFSAGRDHAIRVWDPVQGDELVDLPGHTNYVFSLSFSPDGATLASGSGDFTIRLWETERLGRRLDAERAEQAARPAAERLLERLFRGPGSADKVAELLRNETMGNVPLQRAAQCPVSAAGTRAAVISLDSRPLMLDAGGMETPRKRPWWRYLRLSVRGLMLVVLAVGGCLGWWLHLARVQRQAVAAIRAAGGSISYEWDVPGDPSTPGWRRWVAEHVDVDLTSNVVRCVAQSALRRGGAGPGRTVRPSGASVR